MSTEKGLTSAEVDEMVGRGLVNAAPAQAGRSVLAIIASNVFTYFNAIFCALAVLVVIAGSPKDLTFMVVVIANAVIGIVQQLRAKRVIDRLALLDATSYEVVRDGASVSVASDRLVQGDLVHLEAGQQVPADARVVSGSAGVNESLLTGEPDEVEKSAGDELLSGSYLATGSLSARLTRVGADSYAAGLTASAKRHRERPSEMVRDIERIVLVAGILVVPVGGLLLWRTMQDGCTTLHEAILQMVGAVIGMIPEGLYLLVTIALALSAMRLAREHVMLHDMRSVESLARADVLCVDKTGTITSPDMRVLELFCCDGAGGEAEARALLATYVATVGDGNATARALAAFAPDGEPLPAAEVVPFSSTAKYSEVTTAEKSLRLGAPDIVLGDGAPAPVAEAIAARTAAGARVLALADVTSEAPVALALVAIGNEVRPDARTSLAEFARQGVSVRVISGDHPLTVSRVAAEAGVAGAERWVDATTLETDEQLAEAAATKVVFGRVTPEQKRALVAALRAQGHRVAMTGDGVNDILAMREADCSISMGSGADAARQAAQVVLLDSDFSHLAQVVAEGRRNVNNVTRSATLFLYKNIFSLALALFSIFGAFAYPLTPNQVSLISFFNIGLPAFLLAFEPNEERREGSFLSDVLVRSLPAALTSFVAIALMIVFADIFDVSEQDVATASTYLLSAVGFLILIGLARPINRYRAFVIVLCLVGFALGCGLLWQVFDINALSRRALVLCIVFALSEVGFLQIFGLIVRRVRAAVAS